MDQHAHHEELIEGIAKEYKEIFENSNQGIYIYLDDTHKICNENFATMLGFESVAEFAQITEPFAQNFVEKPSQQTLVDAYVDAIQNSIASENTIVWQKKTGETVTSKVILTPIAYAGHNFAFHFVTAQ